MSIYKNKISMRTDLMNGIFFFGKRESNRELNC